MAVDKVSPYIPKPGRELNILGLKVIEPVVDRFPADRNYRNKCLRKDKSQYVNDEAHEQIKFAKMHCKSWTAPFPG